MSGRPSPMERALAEAEAAAARGEVPVGAVLLDPAGAVLAAAGNRTEELDDPTAHAELLVIRAGARRSARRGSSGCDLYVTLEPCPMCAQAISFARIRRLYYGAPDPKGGGRRARSAHLRRARPAITGRKSTAASASAPRPSCCAPSSAPGAARRSVGAVAVQDGARGLEQDDQVAPRATSS